MRQGAHEMMLMHWKKKKRFCIKGTIIAVQNDYGWVT